MIADRLHPGDEVRVIAPSRSLAYVWPNVCERAAAFWRDAGFRLTFSPHSRELDGFYSSSIEARVADLHEAFADPQVKLIVTAIGGFNANQLLRRLDYDWIARHPKLLCGYSDITALLNAIYAKTGLVTYHGPHFSTFGFEQETAYTQRAFLECLTGTASIEAVASQAAGSYRVLCPGTCEGTAIGGNLCTLNLLQGTPYMPDLRGAVLFLEDDNIMGEYFPYEFDRNLESLLQQPGAQEIRGIAFGRFHESCRMTDEMLRAIIREKIPHDIPVISGVDFGHVTPMLTFPIGGTVRISAQPCGVRVQMLSH